MLGLKVCAAIHCFKFLMCVFMYLNFQSAWDCVSVCVSLYAQRPEEGIRSPASRVAGSCETPDLFWKPKLMPIQERAANSLQHWAITPVPPMLSLSCAFNASWNRGFYFKQTNKKKKQTHTHTHTHTHTALSIIRSPPDLSQSWPITSWSPYLSLSLKQPCMVDVLPSALKQETGTRRICTARSLVLSQSAPIH